MTPRRFDRGFLLITAILLVVGFCIFTSASLGLLARDGAQFATVAFKQAFLGIGLGLVALLITMHIRYRLWRRYSLWIFILGLALTALVFIPGIGVTSGGATRWISLGSLSFQPAEFLKLATIIYLAAWLSAVRDKIAQFRYSIVPFLVITGLPATLLLMEPNTSTALIILIAGFAMLLAAGARWQHILALALLAALVVLMLASARPYIKDRLLTFPDPSLDPQGAGYQIQQSLIAIGCGGISGRGFGQSIQKFKYLPEPVGDSIFAVAAEEFGFFRVIFLIGLFVLWSIRGLKIATRAQDMFGGLLALGIVILIVSQSFTNSAAMLGVLPLTGLPMLFVSQGGSAMLIALAEVGIVLNISRYCRV